MKVSFTLSALCALFIASAWSSTSFSKPYLMVALGDSITAATFAEGSAQRFHRRYFTEGETLVYSHVPLLGETDNRLTYSWASGDKIQSHFELLEKWARAKGDSVVVLNTAVAGAKAAALPAQADQVVRAMASGKYKGLLYVTLMIGANDACSKDSESGTPDNEMAESLKETLQKIATAARGEKVHVLLSAIPKIPDLGKPEFAEMSTVAGFSCSGIRDFIGECPTLLHWEDESEYADKMKVVDDKNKLLQQVAAEISKKYSVLDFHYSDVFYQTPIEKQFLAKDCFHPNARGQQELSNRLWAAQPWFH